MKTLLLLFVIIGLISCGSKDNAQVTDVAESDIMTDWFYVPSKGTVKGDTRPYSDPVLSKGSLGHDIIVLSDLSGRINYINKDGSSKWNVKIVGTRLTDIRLVDSETFSFASRGEIKLAKISTGEIIKSFNPLGSKVIRNYAKVENDIFITVTSGTDQSNVALVDGSNNVIWQDTKNSKYPRSADFRNGLVAVANTFGHTVYIQDLNDNLIVELEEYYPNEVQFISDNEILVTGEHRNRVFTYNISTRVKTFLYACREGDYSNFNLSQDDFLDIERSGVFKHEPSKEISKGICADDYVSGETLYSPNGAKIESTGELIIADTDNHRVLIIKNGVLEAEITNFDNPVGVIVLR